MLDSRVPTPEAVQVAIDECIALGVTVDQLACLSAYHQQLDLLLNEIHEELIAILPMDRLTFFKDVRDKWIPFRDSTAAFEASQAGSGSLSRVEFLVHLINLTADRIRYLITLQP